MRSKGTLRGDGRSTICINTFARRLVYVAVGQPPRRCIVGFHVIDVHCKRSHANSGAIQQSSTSYAVLPCTGCYSRRVPEAPCRIGRALGAEPPASPTTTVFRQTPSVYLLCNRTEEGLGLRVCHNFKSYCWVLPCKLGSCRPMLHAQPCSSIFDDAHRR